MKPAFFRRSSSRALLLIWVCFLARGTFYNFALPLWEGWDEYAHYAYVEHLAAGGGDLPLAGEGRISREVRASLDIAPLAWIAHRMVPGSLSYEQFWALSPGERKARTVQLERLPASWRSQAAADAVLWEAQQPPLYYWLMQLPLWLSGELPLAGRVFWLRMWSLAVASLVIPVGYLAARRLSGEERVALGVIACIAVLPGLAIDVCRVGNEGPAIVLYATLLYLMARLTVQPGYRRLWLAAGVVVGAGLLSKAYFVATWTSLLVAAGWLVFRDRAQWRQIVSGCLMALAVAGLLAGWWYGFIYESTGTLTGQIQTVGIRGLSAGARLEGLLRMNWRQAVDTAVTSHVWFGGWSFLQVRSWIYHLSRLFLLAGLLGGVWALTGRRRNVVLVCSFLLAPVLAALAYHALVGYLTIGQSTTNGWYLYAVVVPEVLLLYTGIATLLPAPAQRWIAPAAAWGAAALDVYGMLFLMLPYYGGLIRHLPDGRLETFHLADLGRWSAAELSERLAGHHPGWFLLLALLWLAATLALPLLAWRVTDTTKNAGPSAG